MFVTLASGRCRCVYQMIRLQNPTENALLLSPRCSNQRHFSLELSTDKQVSGWPGYMYTWSVFWSLVNMIIVIINIAITVNVVIVNTITIVIAIVNPDHNCHNHHHHRSSSSSPTPPSPSPPPPFCPLTPFFVVCCAAAAVRRGGAGDPPQVHALSCRARPAHRRDSVPQRAGERAAAGRLDSRHEALQSVATLD